jgi:hypothetical protein
MPTPAFYHQANRPALFCVVAQTHADGTVDLQVADQIIVTACPVASTAAAGTCTLTEATPQSHPVRRSRRIKA